MIATRVDLLLPAALAYAKRGWLRHDARRGCDGLAVATLKPCVLCGDEPGFVWLYVQPKQLSDVLGGPPNGWRLVTYALCRCCFAIPAAKRDTAVEALIAVAA